MGRFGYIDHYDLSVFPEHERPYVAKWNAYHVANRGIWGANNAKEFEKHADDLIQIIRELELGPGLRFIHLWGIADERWEFKYYHPGERPKGRSRWYWLIFEFLRGPWLEPNRS